MVQPSAWMWQLEQLRPFAPRLWKNGPWRSMTPALLKVAAKPLSLALGTRLGSAGSLPVGAEAAPANVAAAASRAGSDSVAGADGTGAGSSCEEPPHPLRTKMTLTMAIALRICAPPETGDRQVMSGRCLRVAELPVDLLRKIHSPRQSATLGAPARGLLHPGQRRRGLLWAAGRLAGSRPVAPSRCAIIRRLRLSLPFLTANLAR